MFDSAPPNLPVDGSTPSAVAPSSPTAPVASPAPAAVPPPDAPLSSSGKKEPEDIFASLDRPSAPHAEADALSETPPSPMRWVVLAGVGIVVLAIIGFGGWFVFFRTKTSSVVVAPATVATSSNETETQPLVEEPPTPTPPSPPPNAPPPQPVGETQPPPPPKPAADTDSDGLTDSEEIAVQTNAAVKDSDGDGYSDGDELRNGYDPAAARIALKDSPRWHEVDIAGIWRVWLPMPWTIGVDSGSPGDYLIQIGGGSAISIHLSRKTAGTSMERWLEENQPTVSISDLHAVPTKMGYMAWQSRDLSTTYIDAGGAVLVLKAQGPATEVWAYPTLLEYMVQYIHLSST